MSTTPPWGTPNPETQWPSSSSARIGADGARELPPAYGYVLVVEQQTGTGEAMVWRVDPDPFPLPENTTHEQAQAAALDLARRFSPRHPMSEQHRQVLRLSGDSYLVLVQGMTRRYHFRVSLAEVV